jgi:hypothetical protein
VCQQHDTETQGSVHTIARRGICVHTSLHKAEKAHTQSAGAVDPCRNVEMFKHMIEQDSNKQLEQYSCVNKIAACKTNENYENQRGDNNSSAMTNMIFGFGEHIDATG